MDDAAVNEVTKQLEKCNINVSDISLEVRHFMHYLTLGLTSNPSRFPVDELQLKVTG